MRKIINLFKNEPLFSTAMLLVIIAVVATGSAFAADTVQKSSLIGEESARNFAYMDAGVDKDEVKSVRVVLEKDHFTYNYDVDFATEYKKYEYEVDAKDGHIIDKEFKVIKEKETTTETAAAASTEDAIYISLDKAKNIALKSANIENASDVTFTKAKLKRKNGKAYYDLEFNTDSVKVYVEYEAKVNASDGEILSLEISVDDQDDDDLDDNDEDDDDVVTSPAPANNNTVTTPTKKVEDKTVIDDDDDDDDDIDDDDDDDDDKDEDDDSDDDDD